jgi:hypothetical protein
MAIDEAEVVIKAMNFVKCQRVIFKHPSYYSAAAGPEVHSKAVIHSLLLS